jgi:hypothetical protein
MPLTSYPQRFDWLLRIRYARSNLWRPPPISATAQCSNSHLGRSSDLSQVGATFLTRLVASRTLWRLKTSSWQWLTEAVEQNRISMTKEAISRKLVAARRPFIESRGTCTRVWLYWNLQWSLRHLTVVHRRPWSSCGANSRIHTVWRKLGKLL